MDESMDCLWLSLNLYGIISSFLSFFLTGLAVYHTNETHIPHRLSWRRLSLRRQRDWHRAERSGTMTSAKSAIRFWQSQRLHPLTLHLLHLGSSGEDPKSRGSYRSGAGEGQSGVHPEDIPHSVLELCRGFPGKARLSHRKTAQGLAWLWSIW